jgi:uncharacterized protein (TIGR03118 family)
MLAALLAVLYLGTSDAANAAGYKETDLVVGCDPMKEAPPKCDPTRNTLIDKNGIVHSAQVFDSNLLNPWGIAESPTTPTRLGSPFWISDNNAGVSTLYNVAGLTPLTVTKNPRVVSIPLPGDILNPSGAPTGAVFNTAQAQNAFMISGQDKNKNPISAPAIFLFATEDGTIVGWNPNVNPPGFDPTKAGNYGIIAVDNSSITHPQSLGAVYKGLAIATTEGGATFLYATNFRFGRVEIYGPNFELVRKFTDHDLPDGYAPFNVVPIRLPGEDEDTLFVTFALQNAMKHDDVAGPGHGFVDTFNLAGENRDRFASRGPLNSPWGVALAPADFGRFSGKLLIGNFGNGRIHAFDPEDGEFIGTVRKADEEPIVIDGLWGLKFGNGGNGGGTNTLYFTAGPNEEQDGLFGALSPN